MAFKGTVTIVVPVETEVVMKYYIDHLQEIKVRAEQGNFHCMRIGRRIGRLMKYQNERAATELIEAIYFYRMSVEN